MSASASAPAPSELAGAWLDVDSALELSRASVSFWSFSLMFSSFSLTLSFRLKKNIQLH
jgi:hypothetical protein